MGGDCPQAGGGRGGLRPVLSHESHTEVGSQTLLNKNLSRCRGPYSLDLRRANDPRVRFLNFVASCTLRTASLMSACSEVTDEAGDRAPVAAGLGFGLCVWI